MENREKIPEDKVPVHELNDGEKRFLAREFTICARTEQLAQVRLQKALLLARRDALKRLGLPEDAPVKFAVHEGVPVGLVLQEGGIKPEKPSEPAGKLIRLGTPEAVTPTTYNFRER